jgi:hypothetical protein
MKCHSCWTSSWHHLWWVLDKTLWPRIQTAVKCLKTQRFTCINKLSHSTIIRKSDYGIVLLLKRHYSSALATSRANCEWCLLCKYTSNSFTEHYLEEMTRVLNETVVCASRQCIATCCRCDNEDISKHQWTPIQYQPYSPDLASCDFF